MGLPRFNALEIPLPSIDVERAVAAILPRNHEKEDPMATSEEALNYLESQIPALSESAVTVAYWQTLASGESVLESDQGTIYEVFPDGTRKPVKQIAAPVPVDPTRKVTIG
jgi:hypothetical protein